MKRQIIINIATILFAFKFQSAFGMQTSKDIIHSWQSVRQRAPNEWNLLIHTYLNTNSSEIQFHRRENKNTTAVLQCIDGNFDLKDNHLEQISELFKSHQHYSKDEQKPFFFDVQEYSISTKDVGNLFSCIEDRNFYKQLNDKEIRCLCQAADLLQIKDLNKIFKLTEKRNIITDSLAQQSWVQKRSDEARREMNALMTDRLNTKHKINLSNLQLTDSDIESLDMVREFSNDGVQLTKLNLSGNKLKKLNLKHLYAVFPTVKKIILKNNFIKTVTLADWDEFNKKNDIYLDLRNNQIIKIDCRPMWIPTEGSVLVLGNNYVDNDNIGNLYTALFHPFNTEGKDIMAVFGGVCVFAVAMSMICPELIKYFQQSLTSCFVPLDESQLQIFSKLSADEITSLLRLTGNYENILQFTLCSAGVNLLVPASKLAVYIKSVSLSILDSLILAGIAKHRISKIKPFRDNQMSVGQQHQWPYLTAQRVKTIQSCWKKIKEQQRSQGLLDLLSQSKETKNFQAETINSFR